MIKVTGEEYEPEKQIELWECYDSEDVKLITFGNREVLMRDVCAVGTVCGVEQLSRVNARELSSQGAWDDLRGFQFFV